MRAFLTVLALAGAAALYLGLQGPGVIVDLAKSILRENGLPEVDFEVSDLSLETVTLEGIRIGREGALKIPRISAVFTWRELIDGQVGEISIDDLELTVHRREQGLSFGELDAFVYGGAAEPDGGVPVGAFHWPFRKLTLGNARITLLENQTPFVAMTIDGTVRRTPSGGLEIGPARISATSPEINLTAAIAASISDTGRLAAKMDLERGAAILQGYDIIAEDGSLEISTPLDDLSALEATGRLRVSEIALPFGFATTGDLNLSVRENRLQASVQAEDVGRGLRGALTVAAALAEPLADQPVEIGLTLSASDAALIPDGVLPVPVTHGAADLRLSVTDSVGNLQSLAAADGLLALARVFPAVAIAVEGRGIDTPALPGPADFTAQLRLERGQDGAVALHAPDGITLTLVPSEAEEWLAMLGMFRQAEAPSPLLISLASADDGPLLQFRAGEILQKSRFDGIVRLEGGALPAADARLTLSAIVDPQAGIFDATVERLALSIPRARLDAFTLSDLALEMSAAASERGASGSAILTAGFSGGARNSLFLPGGKLRFPLLWQYEPGRLGLDIRDCMELTLPKAVMGDVNVDMKDLTFCLRQDGRRFLELTHGRDGGPLSATLSAGLSAQGRDIVLTHKDGRRLRIAGKNTGANLHARLGGDGTMGLESDITLGSVTLPSSLLRISGARLSAHGENLDDRLDARVQATVTDLRKPRRFAPLDIAAAATAKGKDALTATGSITAKNTPLKVEWEAEHVLSREKGRASARVIPFEFGHGANQLSDIIGLLDGIVSRPAGRILAAASAEWSGNEGCGNGDLLIRQASMVLPGSGPVPVQGDVSVGQLGLTGKACFDGGGIRRQAGQVLLDNMEFAGDQISAKAVNANIDIATFHPFATAPEQALSVGVVDLGFPLTDGVATFSIKDDTRFDLDALTFNWIGGKVSVAPLQIAPDTPLQAIDLSVTGASLEKLSALVPDKGITGEGLLDGTLPIRLTEDGPAVEKGYLEARGPGILRYRRALGEGEEASAVDDVLSNLQYSKLRIDVDGGLSGGVRIGLHVEGSNPDYLDGYPVVLDVNVNGPLGAIMNDGLATYTVPSQILDRMRRFGQLE